MKYDKKIAKHYSRLSESDYNTLSGKTDIEQATNLSALLTGECVHFSASGKPAPNAEKHANSLIYLLKTVKGADYQLIDLYGMALKALVSYEKITGDTATTSTAVKTLSDMVVKAFYSSIDFLFSEDCDNRFYLLSALEGISKVYRSTKDEKIKTIAFEIARRIEKSNLDDVNGFVHPYLKTACALINFATYSGESAINGVIGDLLENYKQKAESLNFESSQSFDIKNISDPKATAKALELAISLYKKTGDIKYRMNARRIWFNGMQFCQRENGGVGYNSFTNEKTNLFVKEYEVKDIVTPLYGEGLKCYATNKNLFNEDEGNIHKDSKGRIFMGDKMFAKDESEFFGHDLIEIPTLTAFDRETAMQLDLKITF